ncbi:MAG: hypothetical protein EXR48_00145 [Dehalococcoidia bacterium]|nr:hypothetical protein [Dehalococcoidia bacterium]
MMRNRLLKEKLCKGEPALGLFINTPSPALVEMSGLLGFDYVILDAEHGIPDLETCEHLVRAAETAGITPVVRVALNLHQNILRYLDTSVMGVQVPMVDTREDAEGVVSSVLYPPQGRRGLAGVGANRYGFDQSMAEYVETANREMLVVVQLETTKAIANVREIASVDGIDVLFFGPMDLSASMGIVGQTGHPDLLSAIASVVQAAREAGKATGTIASDAAAYERWRKAGSQYLSTSLSGIVRSAGSAYLESCRARERALSKSTVTPRSS